jgi:hypothetical protein
MDDDGDLDVVAGSYTLHQLTWWETGGEDSVNVIVSDLEQISAVEVADVNGDDYPDVIAGSESQGVVYWWDNDNGDGLAMARMTVTAQAPVLNDIAVADLQPGGNLEIVVSSELSLSFGFVTWYEDDGNPEWTPHRLSLERVAAIDTGDVDQDDAIDIIACAGTTGLVYRNDHQGGFTPVIIERSLDECDEAIAFDQGGEPVLDILFGNRGDFGFLFSQ